MTSPLSKSYLYLTTQEHSTVLMNLLFFKLLLPLSFGMDICFVTQKFILVIALGFALGRHSSLPGFQWCSVYLQWLGMWVRPNQSGSICPWPQWLVQGQANGPIRTALGTVETSFSSARLLLSAATFHLELHNFPSPNIITLCFVFAAISVRMSLLFIYQTLTPSSNFSIASLMLEILPLIPPGALSPLSSLPLSLVFSPHSVYTIALEMLVCMSGFSQDCELYKGSDSVFNFTHLVCTTKIRQSRGSVNIWWWCAWIN